MSLAHPHRLGEVGRRRRQQLGGGGVDQEPHPEGNGGEAEQGEAGAGIWPAPEGVGGEDAPGEGGGTEGGGGEVGPTQVDQCGGDDEGGGDAQKEGVGGVPQPAVPAHQRPHGKAEDGSDGEEAPDEEGEVEAGKAADDEELGVAAEQLEERLCHGKRPQARLCSHHLQRMGSTRHRLSR